MKKLNAEKLAAIPKPEGKRIPDNRASALLYSSEQKRTDWIKTAATQQAKLLSHTEAQYWTHSIPEQLFSVLESFSAEASARAAQAFLEQCGFTVSEPDEDDLASVIRIMSRYLQPGILDDARDSNLTVSDDSVIGTLRRVLKQHAPDLFDFQERGQL